MLIIHLGSTKYKCPLSKVTNQINMHAIETMWDCFTICLRICLDTNMEKNLNKFEYREECQIKTEKKGEINPHYK